MKNVLKAFGVIALAAIIGFSMAACGDDDGGSGGPQTATYTGKSGNDTYTLKITENTARYSAQIGDAYELIFGTKKSTGKVDSIGTGGVLNLQPSNALTALFIAIISGNNLTALNGTITWTDTSTSTAPGELTGGNQGGGEKPVLSGTSWSYYNENHGATEVLSFSSTGNSVTLKDPWINLSGTYTVAGSNVTIKFTSPAAQYTGVISGTTLTITTDRNEIKIFQKQ